MSQKIEDVKYFTTNINGETFWSAMTDNTGFRTFAFETKEICQLATTLFLTSGCDINEFHQLIGPTLRIWKINSNWAK